MLEVMVKFKYVANVPCYQWKIIVRSGLHQF